MFVSTNRERRIDLLHARKTAAMLQWATGFDRPVILEYDSRSGDSGGRPLSKQIDESGDVRKGFVRRPATGRLAVVKLQ